MNRSRLLIAFAALGLVLPAAPLSHAEEKKPIKIDKETQEKAKDMLDKLVGEVKEAANKGGKKSSGSVLWPRSKETLMLSREDYLKKVVSALAIMVAEVQAIEESGVAIVTRDYYQTRLQSLKQQVEYCKRDLTRLQESPTEEAFRVKQRGFDRGLGFLADSIELAQEEAGL